MSLSNVIERCVEKAVIAPLEKKILACISTHTREGDLILEEKLKQFKSLSQTDFGIDEENQSADGWLSSILELNLLVKEELPCDQLCSILACARSIYNTVTPLLPH